MKKFMVNFTFHGKASRTIDAESKEDADAAIESEVDKDDFEIDAEEIYDVDFDVLELHPVTREGREIWTTYVFKTDIRGHQSLLSKVPLFGGDLEAA